MPITALPTPPSRDDPANFAQRADAFLGALPAFAAETNAVANEVEANAGICQSAAMVVSVTAWVSGATYADGVAVYDTTDYLTYRRKGAGAGTTRPGLDATNWQLLTGFGDATLGTDQTFTGVKTFAKTIQGSVSGNAGSADNCARQVLTAGLATGGGALTANRTITVPAAAQAAAEAGTENTTAMTPLRTAQAIAALAPAVVNTTRVLAATANGGTAAIGTYAFLRGQVGVEGSLYSGASMQYTGGVVESVGTSSPGGTWRCMGRVTVSDRGTLYLRVA